MSIRALIKEQAPRAIALATSTHVLIFRHSPSSVDANGSAFRNTSQTPLQGNGAGIPRCLVEFSAVDNVDLSDYRSLSSLSVYGTLGLITINNDAFLCVVSSATRAATVRPEETVQRINAVEFHCLSSSEYDMLLHDLVNPYATDQIDEDGFDLSTLTQGRREGIPEHPCLALKKLLSSGTFYYSADFDLTRRLQKRITDDKPSIAIDSLDSGFLWNSYMVQPLLEFRSRLSPREKDALDASRILTSAIRGFCLTINVPISSSPIKAGSSGLPSHLTLVSRLSCRRAGTRFNARGIDDDGNVANYVETETIFWSPSGLVFSYIQIRGSVPIFWEQASGLLPHQQKVTITRSTEATQPAFDKHFAKMEHSYGAVHVVNLLSDEKPGELELSQRYYYHVAHSPLNGGEKQSAPEHHLLKLTNYDFHAETRGPAGYEQASQIKYIIQDSADGFAYFLAEDIEEMPRSGANRTKSVIRRVVPILQQEGVFRTNCLDCLDRTNLIQTIISQMAFQTFLDHRSERASPDFWARHGSLWADNGDHLSRIYAGTGALKTSFTRYGKMSLGGVLADARKSATRLYMNNFADKGRQNTIDMLLGRIIGQIPVQLYDPINDYVQNELKKREVEYTTSDTIRIWVGTFNLNGKSQGLYEDLSSWLCPPVEDSQQNPEIVAVGFQEIVELSPQQIMSTDPAPRQAWEATVKRTLNENAAKFGDEEYVLLRGGQLVGASLSIFVKASVLQRIKNVEGSVKKTGLSGTAGNKGAVAIRMDYANTSICFVTAHLAAGFANYEERNRDYKTISDGLRFQRDRSIHDHHTVIWFGDFNYRIGLNDEQARRLIEIGDLETLYENDQLKLQMGRGYAFPFYDEARITFNPTYKYDVGTDSYDTSEKQRIPAWCDRVLRKGDNLRQINYNTAPLRFSDHRPVYATFLCEVSLVDEKHRDDLSTQLYRQRKSAIDSFITSGKVEETEDEDLNGYESIEPGLPPASSDKRKWWLDNGMPAQSTLQPPSKGLIPNPKRPSNPFAASEELDWVKVHRSPSAEWATTRSNSTAKGAAKPASTRRLPPPFALAESVPQLPPRPSLIQTQTDGMLIGRSGSPSSVKSVPIQSSISLGRKPAPPVPKKPAALSSPTNTEPNLNPLDAIAPSRSNIPPTLPPPRRSIAAARSSTVFPENRTSQLGKPPTDVSAPTDTTRPQLPPRRNIPQSNMALMDARDEESVEGLKDWEVLKPG